MIGKNMKHALKFVTKYKGWHTFTNNRATKNAITRLKKLGLVKVNGYNQFKRI